MLAAKLEHQRGSAPVSHRAIVAAGIDQKLAPVSVLDARVNAVCAVRREVAEAVEPLTLLYFDR